jgi:hypothetical protein
VSFRDETASTAFAGYFFVTKRAEIFCGNRFRDKDAQINSVHAFSWRKRSTFFAATAFATKCFGRTRFVPFRDEDDSSFLQQPVSQWKK